MIVSKINLDVLLKITVYVSLVVQVLTGALNTYVLNIKKDVAPEFFIIKDLIKIELIVQIIEGIFYAWLAFNVTTPKNITKTRYYDWFFTTPTMLITLTVFLLYLKNKETVEKKSLKLKQVLSDNKKTIIVIVLLNALMLLFGYLGEKGKISNKTATLFGFVPFIMFYYIIYDQYAKYSEKGKKLFTYFVVVWSIYGLAMLLPYKKKNVVYNILDIFSKNFFSVYLSYILYKAP
jgi:bacteriorhodopsin